MKLSKEPKSFSILFASSPVGGAPPPFFLGAKLVQKMLWFTCPPPSTIKIAKVGKTVEFNS